MKDLIPDKDDPSSNSFTCGGCSQQLHLCSNAAQQVCNVCLPAERADGDQPLCAYCQYTKIIPDLSVEGNLDRWRKLERAKRRVLVGIQNMGVPLAALQNKLPLSFKFKADAEEPVATGHANGIITINIREADSVEREKSRVEFREPHRTLVGHFRHELGHYFWELLVKDDCLDPYRELFGDETHPSYADALEAYYDSGPPADWQANFVSAYATMHPWEDFAETFGTYLDLRAVLDTAVHFDVVEQPPANFDEMLVQYQRVGILANEWNRDMGLLDLVPEIFVPAVTEKIRFVHELLARSSQE